MEVSNFPFIADVVLRRNLDEAFEHILVLLPFLESKTYDEAAKSSFRKTLIIYTASIVEALLYHLIDTKLVDADLQVRTWELSNKHVLYKVNDGHEVIAGDWKVVVEQTKKEKLNLGLMNMLLREKGITPESLFGKVDWLRELRNSQHMGPHRTVRTFTKTDLEKAFSVAGDVKSFVKAKI